MYGRISFAGVDQPLGIESNWSCEGIGALDDPIVTLGPHLELNVPLLRWIKQAGFDRMIQQIGNDPAEVDFGNTGQIVRFDLQCEDAVRRLGRFDFSGQDGITDWLIDKGFARSENEPATAKPTRRIFSFMAVRFTEK